MNAKSKQKKKTLKIRCVAFVFHVSKDSLVYEEDISSSFYLPKLLYMEEYL